MKVQDYLSKVKYSDGSGISCYVDSNLKNRLNEFGVFEEYLIDQTVKTLNDSVATVSAHLNEDLNESIIGKRLFGHIQGIEYDARLGYFSSLYVGYVSEGTYRSNGSSGGMGTWILSELLNEGEIDAVIHVKKANSSDKLFEYQISRSSEEVLEGAKTKYYPVELSEVLQIVKANPLRYAIVGIPSFIMSLRLLSDEDELIRKCIVITIGLICGHQKSSKFAESLGWLVGISPGKLVDINFRKKLKDRPAHQYAIEVTGYIEGELKTIEKPITDILGQNWGQGFFKVYSSDYTDDVMNETADIALGDAWLPEFTNDYQGNNVVIVRHPSIDRLLKKAISEGRLSLKKVDKETVFKSQEAHYRHTRDELAYRLYKRDKNMEWRPRKRVVASKNLPYFRRKIQDKREEISVSSHKIYLEAVNRNDLNYFVKKMSKLSNDYDQLYRMSGLFNEGLGGLLKRVLRKILK